MIRERKNSFLTIVAYDYFWIKEGTKIIEILKILKNLIKNILTILTIFNYFREFTLTILVKLKISEKY